MTRLSKSFKQSEGICKCGLCPKELPAMASIIMLQMLHTILEGFYGVNHSDIRIVVTSWIRCWLHNKRSDGSGKSRQQKQFGGDGADFKCYRVNGASKFGHKKWKKIDPKHIYDLLDDMFPNCLGLGLYINRVHADSRKIKRRWKG